MLYNGERIGDGSPPACDIAVDPIDGTSLTALGRGNALSVIAVAERGSMFDPGPCFYMEKIAVGPLAKGAIDINATATENLHSIAKAKGESVRDLTVVILDRDRHRELIAEVREAGARVRLISDGDVYGAIAAAWPDAGVDVLMGIGGTPEGVIAAAALKGMGGELQGRLWPRTEDERFNGREGRLRDRAGAHHRRPGAQRRLLLRRDGHHRRRAAAGRPLRPPGLRDAVAGDAVPLGHGPPRQRPPPARQAAAVRHGRLRLTRWLRRNRA